MISLAYVMVALAWLAILCTFRGGIAARPHHLGSAWVGDAHQGGIAARPHHLGSAWVGDAHQGGTRYVIPQASTEQYKQQQHYMVSNC
jgi:hypothetical protein